MVTNIYFRKTLTISMLSGLIIFGSLSAFSGNIQNKFNIQVSDKENRHEVSVFEGGGAGLLFATNLARLAFSKKVDILNFSEDTYIAQDYEVHGPGMISKRIKYYSVLPKSISYQFDIEVAANWLLFSSDFLPLYSNLDPLTQIVMKSEFSRLPKRSNGSNFIQIKKYGFGIVSNSGRQTSDINDFLIITNMIAIKSNYY